MKAAYERFGKILVIADGALKHRLRLVAEEIQQPGRAELEFLPPGCPDPNAIEEVWRQMKHSILDVPYVQFSSVQRHRHRQVAGNIPTETRHREIPLREGIGGFMGTGDRAHAAP